MKVALVYQGFSLGASLERDRVLVARELVAAGEEVHLYGDPTRKEIDVPGAVFHPVTPRVRSSSRVWHAAEYASFGATATRLLRRDRARYDVIDVAGTTAWEHDVVRVHAVQKAEERRWPERGGRTFRAARVRAFVSPVTRPKMGVARVVERLQFRPGRFSLLLPVAEGVARDLEECYGVPRDRIEVVPYPIELDRLQNAERGVLRGRIGVSEDEPLVLFVGHDFERKGLAEAIDAFAGVAGNARLAVVGDGDRERYARRAERAGVGDRVHFVGGTETPETMFADADVFLLPTREDVWGGTLIEAMAAGVPAVTTAVAGAAQVIRDARAGIVVPDGVTATRDAIASLLRDPSTRRAMGEAGRAAAVRFGVEAVGRAVRAAYARVLEERGGRAR